MSQVMRYELFYWPGLQGRGEFVRLALEAAGAEYVDVGREAGQGVPALRALLQDEHTPHPVFGPPALRAGEVVLAQTALILQFLGPRLGLVPDDEPSRLWAHQLQLTVTDFLAELHDTHHPLATHLTYADQKSAALERSKAFRELRLPKFLGYFERALRQNPHGPGHAVAARLSYVDLSFFQLVAGLRYAFPRAFARVSKATPHLVSLAAAVEQLPRLAAYLASPRRWPFNEDGLFRRYPELDD